MTSPIDLYKPLKFQTLNPATIGYQKTQIVPLLITLESQEACEPDREGEIMKKIKFHEGRFTKHGMLISASIIRQPIMRASMHDFSGSLKGTVWISGKFFLPGPRTVLVGARCISNVEGKPVNLLYRGSIGIMIERNQLNEGEVMKVDEFYTIESIVVKNTLLQSKSSIEAKPFRLMNIPITHRYLKFAGYDEIKFAIGYDQYPDFTKSDKKELLEFNKAFSEETGKSVMWDNLYKKLINPYELVYASKMYKPDYLKYPDLYAKYPYQIESPVSRAYFKVVELAHFFGLGVIGGTMMTLGDAPGGFAQALNQMYRATIVTVSLLANGEIEYAKVIKDNRQIKIDGLEDGSGDLLKLENIKYLHKTYPKTFDFVACDGAVAYEDKEFDHIPLLLSEMICAIGCLKKGGNAVFKLYRLWSKITIDMYMVILKHFDYGYLYKCRSSRIGSFETFFIGKGFKGSGNADELIKIWTKLMSDRKITTIVETQIPTQIAAYITNFNTYYDEVVQFHKQLVLEYGYYEGKQIDREPFYRNQMIYAEKFLSAN